MIVLILTLLSCTVGGCASSPSSASTPRPARPALLEDDDSFTVEEEPAPPFVRPPRPLTGEGVFYVLASNAVHPEVRYVDGQASRNESCPILRGNKLSRKVPPMYVNGQPIGFC